MPNRFRLDERASGVLLHPTSLPGPHGSGDLGDHAYRFVDFLAEAGQRWWQMLPTGPADQHGCPYSAYSAFAGDPNLISLSRLHQDGLLSRAELGSMKVADPARVDYGAMRRFRQARLDQAFSRFRTRPARNRAALDRFRARNESWVDDWALFSALRDANGGRHWWKWPPGIRQRRVGELRSARKELADEILFHTFLQFQFERQWSALKEYGENQGVGLIGDVPIFVAHDSCDVWVEPKLFRLRANGTPSVVSGAAPDAFSKTGQLWNHPLYDWKAHREDRYSWWVRRFRHGLTQFDAVRIDHFLGFSRYWEVPVSHLDAQRGRWRKGPGADLFLALERELGKVPIIAEDLGLVTPDAIALRDRFGYPGMRVLQSGFESEDNEHLPHNYPTHCVAYTGTHDNDTVRGWFANSHLSERTRALSYTGGSARTIHWDMIRVTLGSVAMMAILPLQDILGLDSDARMNLPATLRGNWTWRFRSGQLSRRIARRLREQVALFGR